MFNIMSLKIKKNPQMTTDPVKYIVLDTNVILAYLLPQRFYTDQICVKDFCDILFNSRIEADWPLIRLSTPSICLAEVANNLDRRKFGRDKNFKINETEYKDAISKFEKLNNNRIIDQSVYEFYHEKMAQLVMPINHNFPLDTASGFHGRRPMGTSDGIICGAALQLVQRFGCNAVILLTNDYRMYDVITKCKMLSSSEAKNCELIQRTSQMGFTWSTDLYPNAILLDECASKPSRLESILKGWPLPQKSLTYTHRLSDNLEVELIDIWIEIDNSDKKITIDKLPFSDWLPIIQSRYACKTGVFLNQAFLHKTLMNARKAKKIQKRKKQLSQ